MKFEIGAFLFVLSFFSGMFLCACGGNNVHEKPLLGYMQAACGFIMGMGGLLWFLLANWSF